MDAHGVYLLFLAYGAVMFLLLGAAAVWEAFREWVRH